MSDNSDGEVTCTQSLFVEPVEWMSDDILALESKVCHCHYETNLSWEIRNMSQS